MAVQTRTPPRCPAKMLYRSRRAVTLPCRSCPSLCANPFAAAIPQSMLLPGRRPIRDRCRVVPGLTSPVLAAKEPLPESGMATLTTTTHVEYIPVGNRKRLHTPAAAGVALGSGRVTQRCWGSAGVSWSTSPAECPRPSGGRQITESTARATRHTVPGLTATLSRNEIPRGTSSVDRGRHRDTPPVPARPGICRRCLPAIRQLPLSGRRQPPTDQRYLAKYGEQWGISEAAASGRVPCSSHHRRFSSSAAARRGSPGLGLSITCGTPRGAPSGDTVEAVHGALGGEHSRP